MAASSGSAGGGRGQRRYGLSEWFGLRRHPLPEFLNSLEGLPPVLSELAGHGLPPGQRVAGALSLPAEYYARHMLGWEYVPDRALIFLDRAALYVRAEGPDAPAETMLLDAQSLLYVRSSLLLLYGLLQLKADCGAQPVEVRLEYNTVIWHALHLPLSRFVAAACTSGPLGDGASAQDAADAKAANAPILQALPFKFANGLRYYFLEPGERIHAAVFQPAIWERRGILPSQITPNTLLALTGEKFVIIEEPRSGMWRRQPPQGEYGWIFTYIPRDRVVDWVVTPRERWVELKLSLEWGGAREIRSLLVQPAVAGQWERSWREN